MIRRCIRLSASLVAVLTIISAAVSCDREFDFGFKDLCFYHPHTAPVKVNVDWNKFRHIENPTGMTVHVWPQNPDESMYRFVTHNLNEVTLDLKAGKFHAFVFNQSDSEYATIEFHNLEDFEKAEARVKQVASKWYSTTRLPDTKVGSEPEWLAIDRMHDIEVTEEMVEIAEQEFIAQMEETTVQRRAVKSQHEVGTLIPRSIIKSLDIYVHLENVKYLRSALGAIEDMAEGCYISTGETTYATVTHTIEDWRLAYEKDENGIEDKNRGMLKATVSTFGLPAGHTGKDYETNFYIKLLLVDNETILPMDFPVGELLAGLNGYDGTEVDGNGDPVWPELHLYWPEPLPEVEPVGGSDGAFDVGVGDWGDEIVTILPLM